MNKSDLSKVFIRQICSSLTYAKFFRNIFAANLLTRSKWKTILRQTYLHEVSVKQTCSSLTYAKFFSRTSAADLLKRSKCKTNTHQIDLNEVSLKQICGKLTYMNFATNLKGLRDASPVFIIVNLIFYKLKYFIDERDRLFHGIVNTVKAVSD